jgi:hypothetical protein
MLGEGGGVRVQTLFWSVLQMRRRARLLRFASGDRAHFLNLLAANVFSRGRHQSGE